MPPDHRNLFTDFSARERTPLLENQEPHRANRLRCASTLAIVLLTTASIASAQQLGADKLGMQNYRIQQLEMAPLEEQRQETGRAEIRLTNHELNPISSLSIGDTLFVGLDGLEPHGSYQVRLLDEDRFLVSYFQLTSDANGSIEPTPLWYDSGVVGCEMESAVPDDPYRFATYQDAEESLRGRTFALTVMASATERGRQGEGSSRGGALVATTSVPLTVSQEPRIYLSDENGCPQFGFMTGDMEIVSTSSRTSDVFISVDRLPTHESKAAIFLIPDQRDCTEGQILQEVRERYLDEPQIIDFSGRRSFHEVLWEREDLLPGNYDIVVRFGTNRRGKRLLPEDKVTHCNDPGGVVQTAMPACPTTTNFDIAGRPDKSFGLPFFEFADVFRVGEQMWGALEPKVIPQNHSGGSYAAFYVIDNGSTPSLTDVTESIEVVRVKQSCANGCLNASVTRIWNQTFGAGEYDVVIDFGATPADSSGEWQEDFLFHPGLDFIDRPTSPGAWVVEDPVTAGPETVLTWEYAPDPTDPLDPLWTNIGGYFIPATANCPSSSPTNPIVPIHGLVRYPDSPGPHPLVVVVHGNHSATSPSEGGYTYLLDLLASHGMVAVSVDQNCLNGAVSGEMAARAILLLRHLQTWREFNTDPSNPLFGLVDLDRIGMAGHSRGGEAITVAWHFNDILHRPWDPEHNFDFQISSLFGIAPTDGQIGTLWAGTPIVIEGDTGYTVMHGSNDGDVFTFGGHKTYDRAHPVTGTGGGWKSLLFVHGANHNFWNTDWASTDDSTYLSSSSEPTISPGDQQAVGQVFLSAFFQEQLLGKSFYRPLFTGDLEFESLPAAERIHQYQDSNHIFINHYQEDTDLATASYPGATNSALLLSPYSQESFDDMGAPYHLWQDTQGLIAGWVSSDSEYVVEVPTSLGADICDYSYLSFRVGQGFESSPTFNSPGDSLDFTVQLDLSNGTTNGIKVSSFDQLPYPVTALHPSWGDASKTMMKTVRIPLHSFLVNRINQNLQDIERIRFRFNRDSSGLIAFDDLQLTQ